MQELIRKMVEERLLDTPAAERALALMSEGKSLDQAVLACDGVSEEQLLRFLARVFDLPYADLEHAEPTKEFLSKFPTRLLVQHNLLPLEERDGVVLVATCSVCDSAGLDELRVACGRDVRPAVAPSAEIDRHIKRPARRRR